jgi:hypothetical protein
LTWRSDPPTEKQLWYLRSLDCSAVPRSKGEAADWIYARVPKPKALDPAEIVDMAAERAMRDLAEAGKTALAPASTTEYDHPTSTYCELLLKLPARP